MGRRAGGAPRRRPACRSTWKACALDVASSKTVLLGRFWHRALVLQERTVNMLGELFDRGGRYTSGQEVLAPCIHHFDDPMNFSIRSLRRQPVLSCGR